MRDLDASQFAWDDGKWDIPIEIHYIYVHMHIGNSICICYDVEIHVWFNTFCAGLIFGYFPFRPRGAYTLHVTTIDSFASNIFAYALYNFFNNAGNIINKKRVYCLISNE